MRANTYSEVKYQNCRIPLRTLNQTAEAAYLGDLMRFRYGRG